MVQRKLFANMPAHVLEAYNEANRRFSQSIKSAEDLGKDNLELAERRKESAATVLAAAFSKVGRTRPAEVATRSVGSGDGRITEFDNTVDALSDALKRARATRVSKTVE